MVVFLARLSNNYSYSQFLKAFSYAIYDFCLDRNIIYYSKDQKNKNRLIDFYGNYGEAFIQRLGKICIESQLVEREDNSRLSKQLLNECLHGKHRAFARRLRPYLTMFLPIRAKK